MIFVSAYRFVARYYRVAVSAANRARSFSLSVLLFYFPINYITGYHFHHPTSTFSDLPRYIRMLSIAARAAEMLHAAAYRAD